MNCRCVEPISLRRKRYTSNGFRALNRLMHVSVLNGMRYWVRSLAALRTFSKLGSPLFAIRNLSWISRGPSMLKPTRNRFSFRNSHHSSVIRVPLVCRSFSILWPGFEYFLSRATTFWKKSRPSSVGSPPCQVKTTSSPVMLSMYVLMTCSSTSFDMRPVPGPRRRRALLR